MTGDVRSVGDALQEVLGWSQSAVGGMIVLLHTTERETEPQCPVG